MLCPQYTLYMNTASSNITIRLDAKTRRLLRKLAEQDGISDSATLVRLIHATARTGALGYSPVTDDEPSAQKVEAPLDEPTEEKVLEPSPAPSESSSVTKKATRRTKKSEALLAFEKAKKAQEKERKKREASEASPVVEERRPSNPELLSAEELQKSCFHSIEKCRTRTGTGVVIARESLQRRYTLLLRMNTERALDLAADVRDAARALIHLDLPSPTQE